MSTVEEQLTATVGNIEELLRGPAEQLIEASGLARVVVLDTAGAGHPLMAQLVEAGAITNRVIGACRAVVSAYRSGLLVSPRLRIARELEGDLLDTAEAQARAARTGTDPAQQQVQRAVATFLTGAALEDALRRICDKHAVSYPVVTSIAKLAAGLYSPSAGVEHIDRSEHKHVTAWGDLRNTADHGKFAELNQTDVESMIPAVRGFIDRHLP